MAKRHIRKPARIANCTIAGVILLGWYLLVPPINVNTWRVEPKVPLSQWQRAGHYHSLAECVAVRKQTLTHVIPLGQTLEGEVRYSKLDSQCVSGDDPRLAPAPNL
jgi:hypothetical protein